MTGDPRSIRFEDYSRQIMFVAHKVHKRAYSAGVKSLLLEDVFQEGSVTFAKCQQSFDPSQGVKFSTFLMTALYRNLNRWIESQIEERHISLDAPVGDSSSSETELHEYIGADQESQEDILIAKEARARAMKMLSPEALKIIDMVENPPVEIVEELRALQSYCEMARGKGIRKAAPVHVTPTLVMDFLKIQGFKRKAIYREFERVAAVNGR